MIFIVVGYYLATNVFIRQTAGYREQSNHCHAQILECGIFCEERENINTISPCFDSCTISHDIVLTRIDHASYIVVVAYT